MGGHHISPGHWRYLGWIWQTRDIQDLRWLKLRRFISFSTTCLCMVLVSAANVQWLKLAARKNMWKYEAFVIRRQAMIRNNLITSLNPVSRYAWDDMGWHSIKHGSQVVRCSLFNVFAIRIVLKLHPWPQCARCSPKSKAECQVLMAGQSTRQWHRDYPAWLCQNRYGNSLCSMENSTIDGDFP